MAKQDNWLKVTVRIPPDLHRRLVEATGANSLNAEIVARLAQTLDIEERNEAARQRWRTGLPPEDVPPPSGEEDYAPTLPSTGADEDRPHFMEELRQVLAEEQSKTLMRVLSRFGMAFGQGKDDPPRPKSKRDQSARVANDDLITRTIGGVPKSPHTAPTEPADGDTPAGAPQKNARGLKPPKG